MKFLQIEILVKIFDFKIRLFIALIFSSIKKILIEPFFRLRLVIIGIKKEKMFSTV